MKINEVSLKARAISLRKKGKTYSEINNILHRSVPKSTLSCWCKNIILSNSQIENIKKQVLKNIIAGQKIAVSVNRRKREKYLQSVKDRIKHLENVIKNKDVAKIALSMIYLGEGAKNHRAALMIGNSDPVVVGLFLRFLRYCYDIDETKFRCTVQCRADQNTKELEKFWSKITKISLEQFYKARIDPRTIGKPSKKLDYKGVCRIDYFSADIYTELMKITEII